MYVGGIYDPMVVEEVSDKSTYTTCTMERGSVVVVAWYKLTSPEHAAICATRRCVSTRYVTVGTHVACYVDAVSLRCRTEYVE